MSLSRHKKKLAGQHTIEYIILLTLIMAGIIVMSPYVIRSWNANLKGWEDSVVDSQEDPFLEAGPITIQGCDPSGWEDQGCNFGIAQNCTGSSLSCSKVESLEIRTFSPGGCECLIRPAPPDTARRW